MILRIGENKATLNDTEGTITVDYIDRTKEVINVKDVDFVYFNPNTILKVVVSKEDK